MKAGQPYDDVKKLREINSKSNEDLKKYVSDVRGRIPIFGYPLITYSPPSTMANLWDEKVWN